MGDYIPVGCLAGESPARFEDISREDVDNAFHEIQELAQRWRNRI